MYLKSLEIQGFKSFPDKTVLQFGDDITAIVGPNGSGKSNISDAIRWVMGEQSTKALRGSKMEDVIFGGTQKRNSVGFAEATLVLDNSDGSFQFASKEIAVTRRYYRSGESEYYINKRSARLRDINELFMDTGLGREGYSNISQGRIDEILSLRSIDRREIFEEAAGISKFRHRKEETERRLAVTQENLMRIGDKISELELQVEPLRIQAEKAKKYLSLKENLKGLEVAVWLESLERLSAQAQKAEIDYNSATFILAQAHEEIETLYQSAEDLTEMLHAKDFELENLRSSSEEISGMIQDLENKISILDSNINNNINSITRIRQEISDSDTRNSSIRIQIENHDKRILEIDSKSLELLAQIQKMQEESQLLADNADNLTKSYVEFSTKQSSLISDIAEKRAQIATCKQSESQFIQHNQEISSQLVLAESRLKDSEGEYTNCNLNLKEARENVIYAKNTIEGYNLRLQSKAQKRNELQSQFNKLDIDLQTAKSQQHMYQEMERAFEGYSKSVKFTMQQVREGALQGIHGPISSLIHTNDELTIAIEIAIGGAMQFIVVNDEKAGKAAIENLKRFDKGRNTFFPLTTIKGKQIEEPGLANEPGFIGIASELVSYEPQYTDVIRHILGRTVIVEDLNDAIAISRRYHHRFRLVTLDGQIINNDSSMTGGSVSRTSGILSRANALEHLNKQIAVLSDQREVLRKQLESANSLFKQAEYQHATALTELRQKEDMVLKLEGELQQHKILRDAILDAISMYKKDLESSRQHSEQEHNTVLTIEKQLSQLEKNLTEIEHQIADISVGQNNALANVQAISNDITKCKVSLSALEAERQSISVARDHLLELETSMKDDLNQKESLISTFEADNDRMKQDRERHSITLQQYSDQSQSIRLKLEQTTQSRLEIESEKTKAERDAQEKNKTILNMEREAARLEQRKLSAEYEEKQLIDKLWDNYELTRSKAIDVAIAIESVASAQRTINELKKKIHALGEPNLGAISQFELVNERYQYLCVQRDDVQSAKQELVGIINTITDQMKDIFVSEFKKINTFFEQTFTEMFGGGRGSLVLEDPNQPLSCGIEIRVQPPGKQLKTITLLSGGEKAFVAIALYFAILKVRPTPFCMLDEIDAALDDRNVERFAEYLRKLCEKTQFIVITHRRGTMENADVLYGVTMQEQGVSKIIHLNLNELVTQLGIIE